MSRPDRTDSPREGLDPRTMLMGRALCGAVAVALALSACDAATPPVGAVSTVATSPSGTLSEPSVSPGPAMPATSPSGPTQGAESTVPPTPTGSPSYFTPTDAGSFVLRGPVVVDQARQDPLSNLLLRGALHQHEVVLDVTGTPDEPYVAGGDTVLFATCRCAERGSGLRLTVDDPTALESAGSGSVRIHGTFMPVQTARDAVTLKRVA